MRLGLHFAYMQAKCFAYHFLSTTNVSVAPGYKPDWRLWPIPQPRDGLNVRLNSRLIERRNGSCKPINCITG